MASNPSVSVFHFTQRVSSAKIRKYKMATERGMGGGTSSAASPTPNSSTTDRPAKRPKLKLSVRPPEESQDTIAVARPKRDSSLKIRYSENMIVDAADRNSMDFDRVHKPSSTPASGLSTFTSFQSTRKVPTPPQPAAPTPKKPRDYGRDFMSYYVAGGDDEEIEDDVVEVQPPHPKQPAPLQQPPDSIPIQHPHSQYPPRQPYLEPRSQAPAYHRPIMPPPRPAMPQPMVHLIDTTPRAGKSEKPDTVATMIKKLDALTLALRSFGGPSSTSSPSSNVEPAAVPPQQDPELPAKPSPQPASKDKEPPAEKKDVDTFLAMFDDDDDDYDDREDVENPKEAVQEKPIEEPLKELVAGKSEDPLDYVLDSQSELDAPLVYGIQFIQNALRSWAQQRLTSQYTQHYMDWQRDANNRTQPKRGPGRPRRFEVGDEGHHYIAAPPLNIQFDLAKTPEGIAIGAFQDVLDSGCLRINGLLPRQLTNALSLMYMQIDNLINQGSRNELEWQCMSYAPQIEAHRVRVEKWVESHAKHQEEMARQQQIAHQQVIQRMGIGPNHRSQLTAEQAQRQHAIDLERKRSLQHAAQQPHLTKYLTNPLKLDDPIPMKPPPPPQPPRFPVKLTPVIPPSDQASLASSPAATGAANATNNPNLHSSPLMDKMPSLEQLRNMPNLFSRSGQSMKFSFAPTSELAVKAFGAQAFPAQQAIGYLPNRGPMSANPHFINSHSHHMANGVTQQPIPEAHPPAPPTVDQHQNQPGGGDVNAQISQASNPATPVINTPANRQHINSTPIQNVPASSPPTDTIAVVPAGEGKDAQISSNSGHPDGNMAIDQ